MTDSPPRQPTVPPPPPDPRDARRLEAWLGRLSESVAELARHQVALHRELATLADATEALSRRRDGADEALAAVRVVPPPAPLGATSRLRAIARRVVHRLLGLARRVRGIEIDVVARRFDPERPLTISGDAAPDHLRVHASPGTPWGWIDAARLARAAEDLGFVEVIGLHRVLVARRELVSDDGSRLDPVHYREASHRLAHGRRVLIGGVTPPPADGATRAVGDADDRVPLGEPPRRREIRVAVGVPPPTGATSTASTAVHTGAVLLTGPPEAGVERVVLEAPRLLGLSELDGASALARLPVLCLAPDPRPVRDLGAVAPGATPLGDVFIDEARAAAAAALLRHHGVTRVLHVGPGDGCFDRAVLLDVLEDLEVLDLPLPAYPGRPPLPRPGWLEQDLTLERAARTILDGSTAVDASRRTARAALGLEAAEDRPLVVLCADLVPAERPEDFVECAHHLEPHAEAEAEAGSDRAPLCLLVGRGPLAGGVADLARWRGLERFVLATDGDPRLALAAADVVVSTAEHRPLPFVLLEALRRGLPVVATAVDGAGPGLEELSEALGLPAPRTAPAADPEALAAAVREALSSPAPAPRPA